MSPRLASRAQVRDTSTAPDTADRNASRPIATARVSDSIRPPTSDPFLEPSDSPRRSTPGYAGITGNGLGRTGITGNLPQTNPWAPRGESTASPVTPASFLAPATAAPATAEPALWSETPSVPPELPPVVTPLEMPGPPSGNPTAVIRGQSPGGNSPTPGTGDYWRFPMIPSGTPVTRAQYDANGTFQPYGGGFAPGVGNETTVTNGPNDYLPLVPGQPTNPGGGLQPFNQPTVDIDVMAEEARTGRFMFGAAVNSDLGLTGQIVIDERNFNPWRLPTSWDDIVNGTAWRGAGHGFRLEAMPGSQLQRYLVTYTVPYLWVPGIAEPFVLNTSGFYFTRRYFDWSEQRLGGRVALGYRVTQDLSLTTSIRGEEVVVYDPRVLGVPQLDRVVGSNELYSGRVTLSHDTRDNAFLATQGHYFEVSYEQTFGTFDYPRGELDYRQYFLMRERPDSSGRHTLAYSFRLGFSGSETPIFENYFSGGYSTMRGFDFRGASPVGASNVQIGGQFRFLGSMEYFFPLTADDMIKGVVFCDFGTTEEEIELNSDNYRVSPGIGLRLNIPAMGPAPLAMDLAFPVARAPTDDIQNFSFFFGFSR
jgi:outer membrane protein insertion porin family